MSAARRVMVVTGSRAEFGLLRPVMRAIQRRRGLELVVVAAGSHLVGREPTVRDVEAEFEVAARVAMQRPGARHRTRTGDAAAVGRGVAGFARAIGRLRPAWVVVLGDRIEALAAATAASVAGVGVCHIHGGDRAEGIADEAMRHAITKLSHLHCAATPASARRIIRMGERRESVFVTGSPAVDNLRGIEPMGDAEAQRLTGIVGGPRAVVLLHPAGEGVPPGVRVGPGVGGEYLLAEETWLGLAELGQEVFDRVLLMAPNHDAGREQIARRWSEVHALTGWPIVEHLPRERFVALLKRLASRRTPGVLVGNSSAGIIECSALGVAALNIGRRQAGRERAGNVVDADPFDTDGYPVQVRRVLRLSRRVRPASLYGDGRAGERIAALLARHDAVREGWLRKRNTY